MSITHWAAAHRRSILFLVTLLAFIGLISAFKLPVALFPHTDFPRVVVSVDAGDRPAEQMEIAVTREIESAVRPIPGVQSIRSTSSRGSAEVSINFDWGRDMPVALLEVESAINQSLPSLPPGTRFSARRMDPTVFPVTAYSLTSNSLSQVMLRDIANLQLLPLLSSIDGVAKVVVMGGEVEEYRVEVYPEKLNAYDLTFKDIDHALSASNVLQAVGRLEDNYKLYLLLADTRIHTLENIRSTVITSGENGVITLDEIARVYTGTQPQWQKVNADGQDAVLALIYQQPGANTIQIVKNVKQRLANYHGKLPNDLKIANWYDQSELIITSASSVRDAILIGAGLAALVLLLFLRSLKITLVAIFSVPAVLAITVLLLYVLQASFNIMTLGGMAAAVGLIVDDAIVIIEHIIRRLREPHDQRLDLTVRNAAIEFTRPLAASSAATIIIFAPLAFLTGVTGAFFKALSLTMASSLFISFLIAWLAVPLLAEHLLKQADAEKEDMGFVFSSILKLYRKLMEKLLPRPWWILAGILPLLLVGFVAYQQVGSGFMPHMDEGGFVLDYRAKAGTSLTETDRLLRQVEQILQANTAVESYSRRTGAQLGGGLTEANEGDFFIRLKPFPRPPIEQVMDNIRLRIEAEVPGLDIDMALLMEDLIGDLTAVPQPIEIKLFGDQYDELLTIAPRVAKAINKIPGVVDVRDGIVLAGDAFSISVDRNKAALEGVDPDNIQQQLTTWYDGIVTTQIQQGLKLVGIRLWIPAENRQRLNQIPDIWLRAPDGHRFPLRRVATVNTEIGQPQISRENLKRMVAVTGRISGRDLGSTIRDVKKALASKDLLPGNTYYELGGLYQQQQIAFKGMIAVFAAALALVFLLLLLLYEQFSTAISVLLMPLIGISAVFLGLWLTRIELNITAMMGMTMIVGIVTEVSIFYFSEYHELLRGGMQKEQALIQAGINRLRPITMTTLAAILALAPLALALGQGSAMQQPLAVAIISGLLIQIPLVVIIMPLLYKLLTGMRPTLENQVSLNDHMMPK